MKTLPIVAAAFAAIAAGAGAPAQATPMNLSEAEQLRKLDIMLMVTSLRCRTGSDAFQKDYQRFSANQLTELNTASRTLEGSMKKGSGAKSARRALDRISVGMANQYGNGHPWLSCGELKGVAQELAGAPDRRTLLLAADDLLSSRPRQMAWRK